MDDPAPLWIKDKNMNMIELQPDIRIEHIESQTIPKRFENSNRALILKWVMALEIYRTS